MFGRARNQAGVLLELKSDSAFDPKDEAALIRFRNKVWSVVMFSILHCRSVWILQAICGRSE